MLVQEFGVQGDVIGLGLESMIANCEVQQVEDGQRALEILQSSTDYDCILADDKFRDGSDSISLFKFILSLKKKIPFILISATSLDRIPFFAGQPPSALVQRPLDIAKLVSTVNEVLGRGNEQKEEHYVKVPIKSLVLIGSNLEVDLYIKLSEEKFIKAEKIGSQFSVEDFNKYLKKNIYFLYSRRDDFISQLSGWIKDINQSMLATEKIGLAHASDLIASSHAMVSQALAIQGFTPELKEMTDACVRLALQTIQNDPKIADIIGAIRYDEIPYISSHSTTLALIACRLATLMDWSSEATFYKLSISALLHDLPLEEDHWAKLDTKQSILESGLSQEIQDRILKHPQLAAGFVAQASELPGEVEFIVEQHHERPDGSGFPAGLTTKEISTLSALFILSHDLVDQIMGARGGFNPKQFFRDPAFRDRYDRGSFGVVFRTIKNKLNEVDNEI